MNPMLIPEDKFLFQRHLGQQKDTPNQQFSHCYLANHMEYLCLGQTLPEPNLLSGAMKWQLLYFDKKLNNTMYSQPVYLHYIQLTLTHRNTFLVHSIPPDYKNLHHYSSPLHMGDLHDIHSCTALSTPRFCLHCR